MLVCSYYVGQKLSTDPFESLKLEAVRSGFTYLGEGKMSETIFGFLSMTFFKTGVGADLSNTAYKSNVEL